MAGTRKLAWLVTAGPTVEDIDPVRFISNRSSGRMGYAVALAASSRGDGTTLVSGPVSLEPPEGADVVRVRSAREMSEAVLARYADVDVVVMSAAVADFRPKARSASKISKDEHGGGLVIELERTDDILAELGRRKEKQLLVGFALEAPGGDADAGISDEMRSRARAKLEKKNLDAIVLNGPGAMAADRSVVSVLVRQASGGAPRWEDWGESSKDAHARRLVELAAGLALGREMR